MLTQMAILRAQYSSIFMSVPTDLFIPSIDLQIFFRQW